MMKKDFLDSLDVKSPCRESWDEMTGSEQVRFCSHCAKDIHNLSSMTRAEAERLVKNSNGQLCVRYVKTPQGKLITAPPKSTPESRRRARVAAKVLAASLALSTVAYSQGEPAESRAVKAKSVENNFEMPETRSQYSTIWGTIRDDYGNVVPGAKVTLRNVRYQTTQVTRTGADGFYEFPKVAPDVYEIEIEHSEFKKSVIRDITIGLDVKLERSTVLEQEDVVVLTGVVGLPALTVETTETPIDQPIQPQPLLELPRNPQPSVTMGLIPGVRSDEKPKPEKSKKTKKKKN